MRLYFERPRISKRGGDSFRWFATAHSGSHYLSSCNTSVTLLQEADFIEKNQVIYIMNILQDLLPPPSSVPSAPRLPTYSVLLLAHALRATFYPSTFLYPVISRFLLQRPELDTTDVPLLYSLLYSSEDGEWLRERTWMIRFLCEGMSEGSAQDWTVLRRRHTWDLVASMWQAARPEENSLRKAVLEVSCHPGRYVNGSLMNSHSSFLPTYLQISMPPLPSSSAPRF